MLGALAAGLSQGIGLLREEGIKREDEARKREYDLHDHMQRLQFAEELQLQMLEKKLQLSQKYPEYSQFVTSPVDGSVTGFTKYGAMSVLKEGDPDLRESFYSDLRRKDKESTAKVDLYKAQAERNRRIDPPKTKEKDGSNPYDKMSPSQIQSWVETEAKRIDPGAWETPSFLTPEGADALGARKNAAREAAEKKLNSLRTPQNVDMSNVGLGPFGALLEDSEPSAYGEDDVYNPFTGPLR